MICSKCKNVGILNTVLGKDFYYCRTCKEEILLEEEKNPDMDKDADPFIEYRVSKPYDPDDDIDYGDFGHLFN